MIDDCKNHLVAERLQTVRNLIRDCEVRHQRTKDSVQLLAVSKTKPVSDILCAADAGQRCFGENYLQEALLKIDALRAYKLDWHYIGGIQSNKTRAIAEHFHWVHGLSQLKHAERLNTQRPENLPPLNICIQVNASGETSKGGIAPSEVPELALALGRFKRLKLRGLMTLPAPATSFAEQIQPFRQMNALQEDLQHMGIPLDTLSMGMSNDLCAAIAAGSTMVRIGTAIFGNRNT